MIEKKQVVGGEAFPVGSIFVAVIATNPSTLLGYGTWISFAAGRMMVGYDAGDPNFDTVLETGGSKTANHSHTAGTLATSVHSGLNISSHGTHAHNISNTYATISNHQDANVAPHTWAGDLAHQHTAGSLAPSPHTGLSLLDHPQSSFYHNHAVSSATGNFVLSQHTGFGINPHPLHTHNYNQVITHTHTIPSGFGSHSHPQTGMGYAGGSQAGSLIDYSASSSTSTDLITVSAGLPQTTVPAQAGAPSTAVTYNESTDVRTHTVTSPANHTVSGYVEDNWAVGVSGLAHTVIQPSAHTFGGTTGSPTTSGSVTHSVTQPSAHTLGGSTDADGSASHSLVSGYANHTIDGDTGETAVSTVPPYIVVYMWQRTV